MSSVTRAAAAHEDRAREARRQRFGQLPADLLARFALLPEWTIRLATQAGLGDRAPLVALVDRLTEAGVMERRSVLTDAGRDHAFWIRPRDRPDLALYLNGQVDVEAVLRELARVLRRIDRDSGTTDLDLWFDVVDRHRHDDSGLALVEDVDRLVDEDDLPQAVRLVAAARTVAELCPGPLVDAVRRAQWRLDRAHRTVQDNRFLEHYVRRPGIEAAVEALLDGDGRQWALHLRGDGGVGKTMVVRYLAAGRFATDRGRAAFPVARVDFDDLDPRFPAERPADLLLALVGELLGYGSSRDLTARYRRFIDGATRLHQELAGAEPDPAQVTRQRAEVAAQFGRLVETLPGPVLLILDTCEELSKLYAPGVSAPAIDETFALLRLVHEAVPRIRVLFSGRRPLIRSDDEMVRAAGPRLAAHDFVGELQVGGYTTAEADAFLDRVAVPTAARDVVLRLAGDGHGTINPFELAGYAEWVRAEPDMDLDALAADTSDPYVRRRIIGRLLGPARDALPVAAAFGRFDRALIGPALHRLGVDVDTAFQALVVNEWVQIQSLGPSGEPHVIAIDEHLRDRLHAATADALGSDLERLGRDAVDVVATLPLADVPVETIEAALRLLPVTEAAAWWTGIEARITDERAWAWAAQVTPRAAATARAAADARGGADMTAAVLATQAAAHLHTGSTAGLSRIWLAVAQSAAAHPDPATAQALAQRAALALVVDPPQFRPALPNAPTDTLVTNAEVSLAADEPVAIAVRAALAAAPPAAGTPLEAGRLLALAGAALQAEQPRQALEYAERAWQAVNAVTHYPESVDWVRPRRLDLRCHQALLICAMRANEATVAMGTDALGAGERARDDYDGAVLTSLGADCLLRFGLRPLSIAPPRYLPRPAPPSWTHLYARPLVVSYVDRLLLDARGRWFRQSPAGIAEAVPLLLDHLEAANRSGTDTDSIDECTVALIRLCRRYRTRAHLPSLASITASTATAVHVEAAVAVALIDGAQPPQLAQRTPEWLAPLLRTDRPGDPVVAAPDERDPDAVPSALAAALLTGVGAEGGARPRGADLQQVLDLWRHLDLRAGLHPALAALPRGLCGTALLNAGELLALSDPDRGATLLRLAEDRLTDLDRIGAAQADTLAALASRRAGESTGGTWWWKRRRAAVLSSGWHERVRAAQGYTVTHWAPELATARIKDRREWFWAEIVTGLALLVACASAVTSGIDGTSVFLATVTAMLAAFSGVVRLTARRTQHFTIEVTDPERIAEPLPVAARRGGFWALRLDLDPAVPDRTWETDLLSDLEPDEILSTPVYRRFPSPFPKMGWLRWRLLARSRWTVTSNDRLVCMFDGNDNEVGVVVLAGTPVDTYAGARFRVGTAPTRAIPWPEPAQASVSDQALVNVRQMVGRRTVLAVLVAEPVDGPPRPLADQRAGFIELAQSTVEAGAGAVLIVPPLPDASVRRIQQLLQRHVLDRGGVVLRLPPRPKDILLLSTDVKRLVAEPQAVGDVILYLRDS